MSAASTPTVSKSSIQVELFIPCFMDQMYPETGFNMVKILERLGCEVHYNTAQTCCGQPAYNAGFFDEAKEVAVKMLGEFARNERYVVGPTASCVGMLRNSYEHFFVGNEYEPQFRNFQSRVYEFTEFLLQVLKVEAIPGAKLEGTATYHDSCSALRECGIKEGPRKLLSHVEGLQLVEMADTETCCGFGGTFAVKFEQISTGMATQKMDNARDTKADYLISTDSSCLLHLEAFGKKDNRTVKPMHIVDVLASGWE